MTNEIKAIQTEYRGITYRSRTEARWAAYLDELRIPFAYEPEGYEIGGERYLADFWLPGPGCWLEIKGVAPNSREVRVAETLARASRSPVLIAVGVPPIDGGWPLTAYMPTGEEISCAAFTGDGEAVFISTECQRLMITVRGSAADLSGPPYPLAGAARVVANMRFGVFEA